MDLFFKILTAAVAILGLATTVYNLLTANRRAKQLSAEAAQAAKLEATALLSARNETRLNALEGRLGSFEQRIEKRIDQISADIGKVKDLFTDYLIKH